MTQDTHCIWLGLEVKIPDKQDQHDPQEIQSNIREWTYNFLDEGKFNIDLDVTGEGVCLIPRDDNWDDTPIFVRYMWESWFDNPEDKVGRIRKYLLWFPVLDFTEHHLLDTFKEKYTYIVGDQIYNKYREEVDINGVLIAGSEDSVRDHMKQSYQSDIDVDKHMK